MGESLEIQMGKLIQSAETTEKLFDKLDKQISALTTQNQAIIDLRRDHNALSKKVKDDIEPSVKEFKKLKQRGIGILAGVSLGAAGLGASFDKIISKLSSG